LDIQPVTLEGQHVRLEPLSFAHDEPLIAAAADGELWNTKVTIIPRPEGMRDYIQFAVDGLAHGNQLPFAIVRKPGARPSTDAHFTGNAGAPPASEVDGVVGSTRFYEIFPKDRKCAIGYTWLAQSAQRTPINTECKLLLLTHAFETWNCVRVELITDVLNEQSRAAILRLGAKQEGILRKHLILPSGRVRDSVFFSITDDEWAEVKARLAARLQRPAG
jgi:RimJ/RimL family protein N-acetyltransferase